MIADVAVRMKPSAVKVRAFSARADSSSRGVTLGPRMQISRPGRSPGLAPASSLMAIYARQRQWMPLKLLALTGLFGPMAQVSLMPQPSIMGAAGEPVPLLRRGLAGGHAAGLGTPELQNRAAGTCRSAAVR